MSMSIPEANRLGGCHVRVARRDRLLVFSLHHNDEKDSAFVPATEQSSIRSPSDTGSQAWSERAWLFASTHIHGSVGENSQPVIRLNCIRDHVITLQRVHNDDGDRPAAGS